MNKKTPRDEELVSKLRWLIILRVVIVTILLGITILLQLKQGEEFLSSPLYKLYFFIIFLYFLTIIYSLLFNYTKDLINYAYVQIVVDVLFESGIVYITGGIDSPFSFLYILSIISASIILYRQGSFITASVSSFLYGILVFLQHFHLIVPPVSFDYGIRGIGLNYAFYNIFINVSAFYLVAFLSSYLAETLKKTGEELKAKKDDFSQLQAFNENILQSISSGLLTTDKDGYITSFNKAAEKITCFSLEEVDGRFFNELFPMISINEVFNYFTNQESDSYRCEGGFRRKDENDVYLGMTFSLLRDGNEKSSGTICIFQDLSDFKIMEEQMKRSDRLAAIGELSAGMAHEIRNPLASISGSVQVLSRELRLDSMNQRLMDIVTKEADRLNAIISDFLTFANPKVLTFKEENINNILDETIILLQNSEKYNHKINIVKDFETDDLIVNVDAQLIKQMFWNLALNAVQAMPEGGNLKIRTKCESKFKAQEVKNSVFSPLLVEKDVVEISFEDTGVGIKKKDQKKLFTPFYSTKENGTGLGLAIVYKIVESHHGWIDVEAEEGKGTAVKVYLPLS